MKRLVLFFVVFLSASNCLAQSHELILWARNTSLYPWYFYTGKSVTADVRYALDQDKTVTVCLGKSFGSETFSLIPEVCGYAGDFKGYGPEVWIISETNKYSLESYIQYARFSDDSSFGYSWLQAERKLSTHLAIGGGFQVTKEVGSATEIDLGLSFKATVGKFTFSALPMWRVSPQERGKVVVSSGVSYQF